VWATIKACPLTVIRLGTMTLTHRGHVRSRSRPSRRRIPNICVPTLARKRIRWPTDRVVLGEAGSTALAVSAGARLEGRMDTPAGSARNQARPSRHLPLS